MKTISDKLAKQIISLADNFNDSNEDYFETSADFIHLLAREFKTQMNNNYYKLVQWPESQMLMEHSRFNECLFIENIEGHNDVGSSAYMCPIDIYEEIFKI